MMNSGSAIGKCLRDMISTCELGQTRGSVPTETPFCRGNPLWLPPTRRVAHVENLLHRHLLGRSALEACFAPVALHAAWRLAVRRHDKAPLYELALV